MITLDEIHEAWLEGSELRRKRHRYIDFCYGRQWNDRVRQGGVTMTEYELAESTGKRPLTNNLIRQLVKNITGRFRQRLASGEASTTIDKETAERNMTDELDSRLLEEFLISGCAIQRITAERRPNGEGVWIDNVDPDRFICNSYSDPRGNDIELAGMLHDMSLREVCARFGKGDPSTISAIARLYEAEGHGTSRVLGTGEREGFRQARRGRCRVTEAWTLETVSKTICHNRSTGTVFTVDAEAKETLDRIDHELRNKGYEPLIRKGRTELEWHCHWFAPGGELLDHYRSPYGHRSHPFCVKHYPMTDGEVHPMVEDVIDTQKYINRLITLIDQVMGTTAKGVLLFPINQKPDNLSWSDIGERWARPNGVIPFHPDGLSDGPKQIVSGAQPTNAYSLLETELRLMEQISGVNSAMSGRFAGNNMSAALYEAQTENGMISLLDTLACFDTFRAERDKKVKTCRKRQKAC